LEVAGNRNNQPEVIEHYFFCLSAEAFAEEKEKFRKGGDRRVEEEANSRQVSSVREFRSRGSSPENRLGNVELVRIEELSTETKENLEKKQFVVRLCLGVKSFAGRRI